VLKPEIRTPTLKSAIVINFVFRVSLLCMEGGAFELLHREHEISMRFDGNLKKNLQKDPSRNIKAFVEHGTRTTCQRETIDSKETRDFHLDNFLNGILQNYFALSEMTLR